MRLRPAKLGYPRISIQVASEPNEDPRQLIVSSSTLSPQKLAEVSSPHFEAQCVWVFSQRSCHADYLPHIPARHAAVSDYAGVLPAGCVYSLTATRVWQLGPSAAPAPHPTRPRPRPAAAHRHWLREPRGPIGTHCETAADTPLFAGTEIWIFYAYHCRRDQGRP